jgi:NitT/TauT family transport system permease protein
MTKSGQMALGTTAVAIFFTVWAFFSYGGFVEPFFLPTPSAVLKATIELFSSHDYLFDILASLWRVLAAFGLCAVTAVPIGLLMGRVKPVAALLNPFVIFMRYVPISAFIPLLILWTGIGNLQKIIFLWMGTFFYLVALIAGAAASVSQELLDTVYTLGARKSQVIWRVVFPAALPGILDSLRVMMGVGWTYVVLAEIVAAESGIGYMIMEAQRFLQTPRVLAGIFTVGFIGIALDYVFRSLRWMLLPWMRTNVS